MLAIWHWHIEISSRCTLKCPRCSRQEVPDGLINTELKLDFFIKNFSPEFVRKHIEKITFCGDDGDPIYSSDLISTVRYFKQIKPELSIMIVTNGSYKKISWWQDLAKVLNKHDTVHFSIDGWDQESNDIYRVNNDFASIVNGIRTLRQHSDAYIVWAAIAFKFNEDRIDYMQSLANDLGMDQFQLTKSTKFGSVYQHYGKQDKLEPSSKYISSTMRFERDTVNLSSRTQATHTKICEENYNNLIASDNSVLPLCSVGNKGVFINSRGEFFPCCWTANRYTHNNEWQIISQDFNLHNTHVTDVLNNSFWDNQFKSYHWVECQTKCNSNVVTADYAQEW